jgi:2-polyprenyl-3-methyl-5-hydroxy-6-metoxy-1,4-benzoquinol methylase
MMTKTEYPNAEKFAKLTGIPPRFLIEAFQLEKKFHKDILQEESFSKRLAMYRELYQTVYPIYRKEKMDKQPNNNPKAKTVQLFRRELEHQSILDIGCGEGHFLSAVNALLKHKRLTGMDVAIPLPEKRPPGIEFISSNVVHFRLDHLYDVVFSDQVLEHIAAADLDRLLGSVRAALVPGGIFIINMPNRLFGPHDVTQIVDYSRTARITAQGAHLNESTYTAMIPVLSRHGFKEFKTVFPLPKVKHFFRNARFSPSIMSWTERHPGIIRWLHALKYRGRCMAGFEITLICRRD